MHTMKAKTTSENAEKECDCDRKFLRYVLQVENTIHNRENAVHVLNAIRKVGDTCDGKKKIVKGEALHIFGLSSTTQ